MVAVMSSKIRSDGLSSPFGFQLTSGMIVDECLTFRADLTRQPIRVKITREQRELKKYQTGCPHGGGAAEPGQDLFGDDGLNQKQQKR
jgi:hypothetical protein